MIKPVEEYISVEIDYERPAFHLDLDGEMGNSFTFTTAMKQKLDSLGYKKEAEELFPILKSSSYEEIFDKFSYYFDLLDHTEKINEDDEYVYLKVKKNAFDSTINKQPMLFKINNINTIQDLIENGEDLSEKNCYGRNIIHYIKNLETLELILSENKKYEWFSIFELDNFNGTMLHTQDTVENFNLILKTMHEETPALTELFLTGTNVFGQSALAKFAKLFFERIDALPVEKSFTFISNTLPIIKEVSPNSFHQIIEFLNQDSYKNHFKNHEKTLLKVVLDLTLDQKTHTAKVLKI